jgi:hypothetical protein
VIVADATDTICFEVLEINVGGEIMSLDFVFDVDLERGPRVSEMAVYFVLKDAGSKRRAYALMENRAILKMVYDLFCEVAEAPKVETSSTQLLCLHLLK